MTRNFSKVFFAIVITLLTLNMSSQAQYLLNSDSAYKAGAANSGRIWGYMFGDFYAKAHSDSANRGGSNQYSGIPTNRTAFQFRRIYLGYDYNITSKFSAELLLAAEDNFPTGNPTSNVGVATNTPQSGSGDLTGDGKFTFYIKLANIRWKNIWKGTDLVIGQVATPAFPLLSEKVWNYRSIERTISDIRRTPSYDMGATLQGKFDAKGNYGYDLMVGNGSSAKPEADNFKWFYGDVWAMFMDKKLVIDLYADYERLNWVPGYHHSRQMIKGFIAYTTPALTIGAEGYINNLNRDNIGTYKTAPAPGVLTDTMNATANGLSFYVHGNIVPGKLRFFARYDMTNPTNKVDNNMFSKLTGGTGNYNDPYTKENFITAGLDFTPAKNVHFMPNVWYNAYKGQQAAAIDGSKLKSDYDMVYRMTFYFIFGK